MNLNAGMRLQSTVCSTEVVVVRPPSAPVDLRCGGAPMVALGTQPQVMAELAYDGSGTQLGKRYTDEGTGIELLCTKPGRGTLSIGEAVLPPKEPKPLPSSD